MITTSETTKIRTIRMGDDDFLLIDGWIVSPRAGFEICGNCPSEYKLIITECMNKGWLQPVAYVKDNQLFWEELEK